MTRFNDKQQNGTLANRSDKPSEALVRSVRVGRHTLERGRISLVALTLLLGGAGASVLWGHRDLPSVVLAALLIGGPLAALVFVSYSARNAWEPVDHTTLGLLELEIERRRDWIRRMTFVQVFAVVILATGLARTWLIARVGQSGPSAGSLAPSILLVAWVLWQTSARQRAWREKVEFMRQAREHIGAESSGEPADQRWEALSLGALSSDEAEALRVQDPARYELFRPFDAIEEQRITDQVRAARDARGRRRRRLAQLALLLIVLGAAATWRMFGSAHGCGP